MYESSVITGISQHKGQPNLDIPQSWGGGGGVRPSFFDHRSPIRKKTSFYNYIAFYPSYDYGITTERKVIKISEEIFFLTLSAFAPVALHFTRVLVNYNCISKTGK